MAIFLCWDRERLIKEGNSQLLSGDWSKILLIDFRLVWVFVQNFHENKVLAVIIHAFNT